MDDTKQTVNLGFIDPQIMEKYFQNIQFPINQVDLMEVVRANGAPQEIVEQMEQMLSSDIYESYDQIDSELSGMYNDGEEASFDDNSPAQ